MVLGESGRFPIEVYINSRIINFWSRLVSNNCGRTSSIMYQLLLSLDQNNSLNSKWISKVKNTSCGFPNIWHFQEPHSTHFFKILLQRIKDQFIQSWLSDIWNSTSCTNYRIFKSTHTFENYLTQLPLKDAISLCKFRTGSNKIPIVSGKFNGIDREDRICSLCNSDLGDEFHYIFICTFFKALRKMFQPTTWKMLIFKKWINFLTQVNKHKKIWLFLPNI